MNILTFDIEDWYNCDFITEDFNWDKYECRIYDGVDKILNELDKRQLKATFFCLGWIAEKHPKVIKAISDNGHQIGCHSYQHELSFRFNKKEFIEDTLKSKKLIEDVIGKEIDIFRAPGFSITENNIWAFDALVEMGFKTDCSVFPSTHDYGGMPNYGKAEPAIIKTSFGNEIKEFPINIHSIIGKSIVFSGGGFFRLIPYPFIKKWGNNTDYMMTYFHTRDFDVGQPMIKSLPLIRKFKSYVGIKGAFSKFQRLLDDFEFISVEMAEDLIDWDKQRIINL